MTRTIHTGASNSGPSRRPASVPSAMASKLISMLTHSDLPSAGAHVTSAASVGLFVPCAMPYSSHASRPATATTLASATRRLRSRGAGGESVSMAITRHPQANFEPLPGAVHRKGQRTEEQQDQDHQLQHVVALRPDHDRRIRNITDRDRRSDGGHLDEVHHT